MRFPLALKVSLWLLLNLLVLAGLGAAWMLHDGGGGMTWDALVSGPSGREAQDLADLVHAEIRATPRPDRDAALRRLADRHGVELALYGQGLRRLAGDLGELPEPVRAHLSAGRPPDPDGPPPPPPTPREQRRLFRLGDPAAYWLSVRTGGALGPGGAPQAPPAFLVVRVSGFWRLLVLLRHERALWLAAAAIACSVLLWLPLVAAHARALRRLDHATHAIADGRFDTRVPEKGRDELAALGASINRMSGRLDRLVSGQKRFLGDIAHELGSPVGRMQMGVAILETRAPADLQPSIADVREEVVHMADLVAELLAFTRAGLLPREAARARVELAPLAARVLAREAAADAVALDLAPDLAVLADANLLARAVGNLVRNALRYAGRDGAIVLRARAPDAAHVEITVEDEGPGVPPDALERLGEPFFRPETARRRETGGAGLGLAIVRGCAEACGGSVRFANRSPRGFSATLRLASG